MRPSISIGIAVLVLSVVPRLPYAAEPEPAPLPGPVIISTEIKVPTSGMTMGQVEKEFGAPVKKLDPVGKPPITRWNYEKFTVYFENNFVIHAVVPRTLQVQLPPGEAQPAIPPLPVPLPRPGIDDDGPIDIPFQ